jgi:hypothetical protein
MSGLPRSVRADPLGVDPDSILPMPLIADCWTIVRSTVKDL